MIITTLLPAKRLIPSVDYFARYADVIEYPDLFPVLYKRTKNGGTAWYAVQIDYYPKFATVLAIKASGLHHKAQIDDWPFYAGVNLGKANETTFAAQAFFFAQSLIRKLKDDGYKEGIPDAELVHNTDASGEIKPMLAQSYNPQKASFPYYCQPKLNGVRCRLEVSDANGSKIVKLVSRAGKPYNAPFLIAQDAAKSLPEGVYDGEIYKHGWSLQRIVSAVKAYNDDTNDLYFVCYDKMQHGATFEERWQQVKTAFGTKDNSFGTLRWCPTYYITLPEQVETFLKRFEDSGYEGAMLRDPNSLYEFGYRSKNLLKVKNMQDAEFEIVDVLAASGRNHGCAIFVCLNDDGTKNIFRANPVGTQADRRTMYANKKALIGKSVTVQFQERSDKNIPIFPVALVVRDYE